MIMELNEEQKSYINQRLQSFDNHRLDYGPDEVADIFLKECIDKKIVDAENEDHIKLSLYYNLFLDYIENN
jgi:hypothetical protein